MSTAIPPGRSRNAASVVADAPGVTGGERAANFPRGAHPLTRSALDVALQVELQLSGEPRCTASHDLGEVRDRMVRALDHVINTERLGRALRNHTEAAA